MTIPLIITICVLIIIAYAFDVSSRKTKIPTVILLMLMGWIVQQGVSHFDIEIPNLKPLLPILGTVGLILIVLEGGLELEINKSKIPILKKSTLSALVPMLILIAIFAVSLSYYASVPLMTSIMNVIPVCVISSAIAIPSTANLCTEKKEFVVYESSLSDIFGVILFNFFIANEVISWMGVGSFFVQIIIIIVVSLVCSLGLAFLIKKIDHHVKFLPILIITILVYAIAKVFHLPALIFILFFGLLINNLDEIQHINIIKRLQPEILDKEVHKFKEIVIEVAFVVRTMFFILFGYTINAVKLLNLNSFLIAIVILAVVLLVRYIYLKINKVQTNPLLFIAPRGLITILLFFSIPSNHNVSIINETLMTQVILLSAVIMMIGLFFNKKSIQT